jgi:sulfatase maturation enzyme AslB (radical SAM superfamily)
MDLFEEKCYSCQYLPLCMGGCRRARCEGVETGSYCRLVPTNASFALKAIAFGGFEELLCRIGVAEESLVVEMNSDREVSK